MMRFFNSSLALAPPDAEHRFAGRLVFVTLACLAAVLFLIWSATYSPMRGGELHSTLPRHSRTVPGRTQYCGQKSLYVLLRTAGVDTPYRVVRERFSCRGARGSSSLLDVVRIAESFGFSARAATVDFAYLSRWLSRPHRYAILHCNGRHFVPVVASVPDGVVLCDLAVGIDVVGRDAIGSGGYGWSGDVVLVSAEGAH